MASTYLTRAFSSGTITTKATWSFWVKFSKINGPSGGASCMLFQARDANNSSNSRTYIRWGDAATLDFISYNSSGTVIAEYYTTRVLRDCNSWYHICYSVDTTLAAASDRVKLYINGVRETDFDTSNLTNPGVNQTIRTTSTVFTDISRNGGVNNNFLDGLLSYYIFTDGYTYQADTFGSTDSTTGEWKINTSPTVTYGTNGYFILKNGNSVTDQSGNSNNFTVGGGTLTNTEDCPSSVFAVWNTLSTVSYKQANTLTLSNGNTTILESGGNYKNAPSTVGAFTGKYYSEHKMGTLNNSLQYSNYVGVITSGDVQRIGDTYNHVGQTANSVAYNSYNGQVFVSNSGSSYGAALANGDILGIALDVTNLKVYFSKNGVWQNSGNPESGATGTGAVSLPSTGDSWLFGGSPANSSIQSNFGNGFFGTSAVADNSTTTASTPGTFNYDVPTGYQPLSTKGLNA